MRKVIKKQSGGYALPNYIGSQSQPLLPNISSSISQIIDPYDRYAREQQVGIQNSQAYQSVISSQINNYAQLQAIENQKKQSELNQKLLELRAKDFNNTLLKQNQQAFSEMLSMDDNIFLEADDEKYQNILKDAKQDDEYLANTVDYRDSDAIYNAMSKRKALLSTFRNAYKNRQLYIDLSKQLDSIESNLKLDKIAASNYLNVDAANQFVSDLNHAREALDNMRFNGKAIDPNDPVIARLKATTESQFINQDLYKANAEADATLRQAEIDYKREQARKYGADADYRKAVKDNPDLYRSSNKYDIYRAQGLTHEAALAEIEKTRSETQRNNSTADLNETKANDIETGGSTTEAPPNYLNNNSTIVNKNTGEVTAATYTFDLPVGPTEVSMEEFKDLGYKPLSDGRIENVKGSDLRILFNLSADDLMKLAEGKEFGDGHLKIVKTRNSWEQKGGDTDLFTISPDYSKINNMDAVDAYYRSKKTPSSSTPSSSPNDPTNFFEIIE